MDGNVWRPAHLTPEHMEERRLAVAALLRQGRLSQTEIARQLGVSRASVCRWAATLAQECNAYVKRAMENALPGSVADLHRLARREFGRLQQRPELITSFFRHAGLSVAGLS